MRKAPAKPARRWRIEIGAAVCLIAIGVGVYLVLRPPAKLNVVLVTLDTTRADRVGCYGYARARTPVLDELAKSGVLFERAYAPVPLTLPSHASLLSGLYPPEHGLHVNGRGKLSSQVPLLTEALRKAGYETGAFLGAFVLNAKFGLNRGFDTYDDVAAGAELSDHGGHRSRSGRFVMDRAIAWLQERSDKPFFCWIHLFDPHSPYDSRKPVFGDAFTAEPYDAGIAFADMQLSRLREFLRSRRLEERTLVVVVGDHGEGLSEHDEQEHGYQLYESTLRVPLVFSGPRSLKSGHRVSAPVSLVDLTPTVLDCLEIRSEMRTSGRSVRPALVGGPLDGHACYAETDVPFMDDRWAPLRCLINERWKYIETPRVELYDLANDPREARNMAESEPSELQRMESLLHEMQMAMIDAPASAVNLTEAEQRTLESLGYAARGQDAPQRTERSQPLPDVKDMIRHFNTVSAAKRSIEKGDVDDAERMIREVLSLVPHYPAAQMLMGEILSRRKKYAEATKVFSDLVADRPDMENAHAYLGNVLAAQGLFAEAVPHYRQSLESNPDVATTHLSLALTLVRLGKTEAALQECAEALRLSPRFAEAHLEMADLLSHEGRTREAMEHYRHAMGINPGLTLARMNSGGPQSGDHHPEALKQAALAVERNPRSFDARYHLAALLVSQNRFEEAVVQLTEALRLRPGDRGAQEQLQRAKARLKATEH